MIGSIQGIAVVGLVHMPAQHYIDLVFHSVQLSIYKDYLTVQQKLMVPIPRDTTVWDWDRP
jgi:hypothetical protein